jgi:hypothetical protein
MKISVIYIDNKVIYTSNITLIWVQSGVSKNKHNYFSKFTNSLNSLHRLLVNMGTQDKNLLATLK